jgi:LysM repeat protein
MSSMSASAVTAFVPARPRTRPTSTVQLTRRGRLVVFLAALLLVLTAAFLLGAAAVGTADAPPAPHYATWVVGTGETLTSIARETGTSVAELQQINHLDSAGILAGQTLHVPGE